MKKEIQLSKFYYWILPALVVFSIASCKKDNSLGFTPGTGVPTISTVKTISKTVSDTVTQLTTTYSPLGVIKIDTVINTQHQTLSAFDSTTVTGKLGNMYVVNGTNLGSATKLTINGVNVYFNRGLISDNSIIFTLPTSVPYVQPQPNTMVITTLHGTVTYKFTTLPPPPTILQVSDFDFTANSQLTLTGKGFASVTAVKLKATGDAMSIVSQNDSTLVLKAPASSAVTESALLFTYTSGANPNAQTASTVLFNDLDNAYTLFVNDNFQNSWYENSWAGPSGLSTGTSHSGTASQKATYPSGNYAIDGFGSNTGFTYDPSYKYFSFWVKGGTVTHTLTLVGDQMHGGYGQVAWDNNPRSAYLAQIITVPAKVWTFYKIPIAPPTTQFTTDEAALNFWLNGNPTKGIAFFLEGHGGDVDETLYFDEVAFIK